jgi:hypothetical protein
VIIISEINEDTLKFKTLQFALQHLAYVLKLFACVKKTVDLYFDRKAKPLDK